MGTAGFEPSDLSRVKSANPLPPTALCPFWPVAAPAKCIEVPEDERVELERIVRSENGEVRMVERAQIVLYAAEGHSAAVIGGMVGCSTVTTQKWRSRYEREGIVGLRDLPRPGKPLAFSSEVRAKLIAKACTRPPDTPEGQRRERWTYEELPDEWLALSKAAAYLGISTNALHKLTAARAIPFEQDGPGCKMRFKRSELDEWRRTGNVESSGRIVSRGRLTPRGSRTPTPR